MAVFFHDGILGRYANAILALGVFNVILGLGALVFVGLTTWLTVAALGGLFLVNGIAEVFFGFRTRKDGNLAFHLLFGSLAIVLGGFILANPLANAAGFTLLIGVLCLIRGSARALAALFDGGRGRGTLVASGALTAAVGMIVLSNWPASALWTVGVFVGVEILTFGFVLIRLGLGGRRLARASELGASEAPPMPSFPQRQVG